MVIYGIVTETHIGKLFAAGVVPGLLCAGLLMTGVAWIIRRHPEAGPAGQRVDWPERWAALRDIWGVALLVVLVLGGIYGGWFTATEGAGIGASGAFAFALARGSLTPRVLFDVLAESSRTTAMLFTILIAAAMFSNFVNYTSMPGDLKTGITHLGLPPLVVIAAMMGVYVVLGTIMEELSMVLLTIPVFFPVVTQLGFDPVWFGVLIVLVVQVGLISPPVGMNMFVMNALLKNVPMSQIFRGSAIFCLPLVVGLALVLVFPQLALWLPGFMK